MRELKTEVAGCARTLSDIGASGSRHALQALDDMSPYGTDEPALHRPYRARSMQTAQAWATAAADWLAPAAGDRTRVPYVVRQLRDAVRKTSGEYRPVTIALVKGD